MHTPMRAMHTMQVREEEIEGEAMERLEMRKTTLLAGKSERFAAIQARRVKTMRQLIEARKYVGTHRKLVKPTVVEKYAHYGSNVYAPMAREGRFPETKPSVSAGCAVWRGAVRGGVVRSGA